MANNTIDRDNETDINRVLCDAFHLGQDCFRKNPDINSAQAKIMHNREVARATMRIMRILRRGA